LRTAAAELKNFGTKMVEGELIASLDRIADEFVPSVALVRKNLETMATEDRNRDRVLLNGCERGLCVRRAA
jgi:hypothetical protein